MSQQWKEYQEKNKERFLEEMLDLLRIPSISAKIENKDDMLTCAEAVKKSLLAAGCDKAEVMPTAGHPVVYGEKIIDPSKPTVLVYGHYDVQPADPFAEWQFPPFEPVIRGDHLYGRGASDDKGQLFTHVKALEVLLRSGQGLPVNIKCLFEGEEEMGGDGHVEGEVLALAGSQRAGIEGNTGLAGIGGQTGRQGVGQVDQRGVAG